MEGECDTRTGSNGCTRGFVGPCVGYRGRSPSGSLSLERQVSVSPMATEEESKDRESMDGARLPTVAVAVDWAFHLMDRLW